MAGAPVLCRVITRFGDGTRRCSVDTPSLALGAGGFFQGLPRFGLIGSARLSSPTVSECREVLASPALTTCEPDALTLGGYFRGRPGLRLLVPDASEP